MGEENIDKIFEGVAMDYFTDERKILTCSAKTYCDSMNRKVGEYYLLGVRSDSTGIFAPICAEVIVDYRPIDRWEGCGTALIPKEKLDW